MLLEVSEKDLNYSTRLVLKNFCANNEIWFNCWYTVFAISLQLLFS